MFTKLLDSLKNVLAALAALVAGAFAIFFLYTRNNNYINEALLKEQELNKKLDQHDSNIQKNNEALSEEEAKRKSLEKQTNDETNIVDITKRLGR